VCRYVTLSWRGGVVDDEHVPRLVGSEADILSSSE
jgi:hypothetical protein